MRARGYAVVLACIGVALILGVVAPSAAAPAPSFAAPGTTQPQGPPGMVAIADLNGDGLAIVNYEDSILSVLLNRGDGSFRARRDYATGAEPQSVAIDDLNGDRKLDLATASFVGSVSLLTNKGDGSFQARRDYAVPNRTSNLEALAIGDLNGDGKPDLAVTEDSNTVAVLLNATSSAGCRKSWGRRCRSRSGRSLAPIAASGRSGAPTRRSSRRAA
jgi:hypothetical protein